MTLWQSSGTQMAFWFGLLADASAKAAVVLAAAAVVTLVARRASAAWRHLVWTLAICAALIIPLLSGMLPSWRMRPVSRLLARTSPPPARQAGALPEVLAPALATAAAAPKPSTSVAAVASGSPPATRTRTTQARASGKTPRPVAPASCPERLNPAVLVLLLWGLGAVLALVPVLMGMACTWRVGVRSSPAQGADWSEALGEARSYLSVGRRVRLQRSPRETIPMVWGWLRPVVLLPASADHWTRERKRVVLLHELAHVRRADCLWQLLAHLACALYWFNPLAWLACRRLCCERERACDDVVLTAGLRASDYAAHLLDLTRSLRRPGPASVAAVAMARPAGLATRVCDILDPDRSRGSLTARAIALSVLVLAAVLTSLARVPAFAAPGSAPTQLLAAEEGPGGQALYLWDVDQSWPGGAQYDAALDKPVRFWRAALPLAEVFAGIEQQTEARVGFWPEGDENPRVRVNLYLNPDEPPTLRALMAQLMWVTDCTFAYAQGESGEPVYYLLGTSIGHGGLQPGLVEDRARAAVEQRGQRTLERERQEAWANLAELRYALSLPLAEARERYLGEDDYLLHTLTDPMLRAAAEYVCKVTEGTEEGERTQTPGRGGRPWEQLSDEEQAWVREATGFDEKSIGEAEVFVCVSLWQSFETPGAYFQLEAMANTGPRSYEGIGFGGVVAPTQDRALVELERLDPRQIATLHQAPGESLPTDRLQAYADEWKAAVARKRSELEVKALLSGSGISPAAEERLSAIKLPLQAGHPYALWELQEATAAASGMDVVSDCFWQPARPLQEVGSALAALASASRAWADRVASPADAAWLAEWEWGDAGSFLRFRSVDRDAWRAALLPGPALARIDQYLSRFLPQMKKPEWPRDGFSLPLSFELNELLQIGRLLDDMQLAYGGRLLYEDPSDPGAACRHALREAFLSVALGNPVGPGQAGWEANAFRLVASLEEGQWRLAQGAGVKCRDLPDDQLAILRKAVPLWDETYENRLEHWVLRARGIPAHTHTGAHPEWSSGWLEVGVVEPKGVQDLVDETYLFNWRCPYQISVSVPPPAMRRPSSASHASD